jgi:hypothetical protein
VVVVCSGEECAKFYIGPPFGTTEKAGTVVHEGNVETVGGHLQEALSHSTRDRLVGMDLGSVTPAKSLFVSTASGPY